MNENSFKGMRNAWNDLNSTLHNEYRIEEIIKASFTSFKRICEVYMKNYAKFIWECIQKKIFVKENK